MKDALLRRIAGRCDTHDRPSPARIRQLEEELGMPATAEPASLTDALADPDIVDCGKRWCGKRRGRT